MNKYANYRHGEQSFTSDLWREIREKPRKKVHNKGCGVCLCV